MKNQTRHLSILSGEQSGIMVAIQIGKLYGIGVGPGDPELLTVKAAKAIQNADIIMCPASSEDRPSIAFSIVSSLIDKSKNQEIIKLIFPMTKDKDILESPSIELNRTEECSALCSTLECCVLCTALHCSVLCSAVHSTV